MDGYTNGPKGEAWMKRDPNQDVTSSRCDAGRRRWREIREESKERVRGKETFEMGW